MHSSLVSRLIRLRQTGTAVLSVDAIDSKTVSRLVRSQGVQRVVSKDSIDSMRIIATGGEHHLHHCYSFSPGAFFQVRSRCDGLQRCSGLRPVNAIYVQTVILLEGHQCEERVISENPVCSTFDGHIEDGAMLLTDGLRGYNVLEKLADCTVKNVEKETASFYHLNSVNNLHSYIKDQYKYYRGVATKYINRYGVLFSVAYRKTEDLVEMLKTRLFSVARTSHTHTISDVKDLRLLTI